MNKSAVVAGFKLFLIGFAIAVALLMLEGCTFGRYTDQERSLTVIDLHPTGNSVALEAALTGKGKLSLNRDQGGTEGIVSEVGDIVSVNPLD